MFVRSEIQEAKGFSAQVAKFFLWNDNHIVVDENHLNKSFATMQKTINRMSKDIQIRNIAIYILCALIAILVIMMSTTLILYSNYRTKIEINENERNNKKYFYERKKPSMKEGNKNILKELKNTQDIKNEKQI